jgi:DNA repair and recombination protein RAD52
VKIKVPPPKFQKSELHRRPEFEEPPSAPGGLASIGGSHSTSNNYSNTNTNTNSNSNGRQMAPLQIKTEQPNQHLSALPSHMRTEVRPAAGSGGGSVAAAAATTPNRNRTAQRNMGLSTPVTPSVNTAVNQSRQPAPPPQPQPQQQQQQQQKQQPQPERKSVTFVEPSRPGESSRTAIQSDGSDADADDLYLINSEDDAFFACVDLNELDLGRPIDFDEGRKVDDVVEDGHRVGRQAAEIDANPTHNLNQSHQSHQPLRTGNPRQGVGQGQIQRVDSSCTIDRQAQFETISNSNAAVSASSDPRNQHTQNQCQNQARQRTVQVQAPRVAQATTHEPSSANIPGPGPDQNQNRPIPPVAMDSTRNPKPVVSNSSSSSTTKRPVTPSMGGFKFPPGMVRG